jgi:ech hydrogenase subunit F
MAYFEMSRLALRWALSRPPTSRYPFEPHQPVAGARGQLVFTKETCVFCTVCAKKCPTGALIVDRAHKKWTIDRLLCITCGYCVEACPRKSLALGPHHGSPTVTKDREPHYSNFGKQHLGKESNE